MYKDKNQQLEELKQMLRMMEVMIEQWRWELQDERQPLAVDAHTIWFDKKNGRFRRGTTLLPKLTPTGNNLLHFLIQNPWDEHTKTTLIKAGWPDCSDPGFIADNSVYRAICNLRHKIEPDPKRPCYILNWRGRPEGGYRFSPQGEG